MKPNFIILWVDDTKTFVESVQGPIIDLLTDKGFTGHIELHKDEKGVLHSLKTSEVDLIVVDYNLPRKNGDELIEEIRSKNYYQDIIFYSADGRPIEPFKQNPPDGVFFASREDARDIIKRIISLKMRRLADTVFFRGWVVADAIELEHQLEGVLCRCFPDKQTTRVKRFLEQNRVYDFGQKHKILSGIIDDSIAELKQEGGATASEKVKALSACKKILDSFPKEVIGIRNTAAHQESERTEEGGRRIRPRAKQGGIEVVLTEAQCVKIRTNLQTHKKNLDALLDLLT
jgi:CheY-like chemotaxis protein